MSGNYVCVIGSINYDIIMKQKRMPILGETYQADSISYSGGGKGANQCVQCAKLGLPAVMFGKVGDDPFGDTLLKNMKEYGVDCTRIGHSKESTGVGVIHALEDGSVYATIIAGANGDISEEEIDQMDQIIRESRILILQLEIPVKVVEYCIRKASEYGVFIILNAAPAKPVSADALRLVDCLIVNETEAGYYAHTDLENPQMVREHADQLRELCKGTVIVTLGSKGSVLLNENGITEIAPVKVDAVETTGAGDSYVGAFAYGKYHGMSDEDACYFAAKVSAITVTKVGAQEGMPYLSQVKE